MGLTSVGIGSGIDINGIVSALTQAESAPKVAKFDADEGRLNTQISAMGSLKSALKDFQDSFDKLSNPDTFVARKATLSNSDFLTAEASQEAVPGSYKIEVEQLAQSQKLGSAVVTDVDAPIGEGQLTFTVEGEEFSIDVSADDSLESIMQKINDSDDELGVTATIINGEAGPQLVMSSDKTGVDQQIMITATDTDGGTGLADTFSMTELSAAKDAILYVDGLKVTSGTNEIENVITGVDITLTDADVDKNTKLTIATDTGSVEKNIESFVDAYNKLAETMSGFSGYDAETQRAGVLQGDSMIRSIQSQMRGVLSSGYETSDGLSMLANMGIKTTQEGTLEIDEDQLETAIRNDLPKIKEMFSAEDTGLASRMDGLIDVYVKTGGTIDSRDTSLDSQIERITQSREQLTTKMVSYEARLLKQYNAMDLIVANLNSQSSSLASRLDSLPGVVRNN